MNKDFLKKLIAVFTAASLFVLLFQPFHIGDKIITVNESNETDSSYYIPKELEDFLLTYFELGTEIFYIEGIYNSYYEINFGTNGPIARPLADLGTVTFNSAVMGTRSSALETDLNIPVPAEVWTIDAFRIISNTMGYSSLTGNTFSTGLNFNTSTTPDFYLRFYGRSNY